MIKCFNGILSGWGNEAAAIGVIGGADGPTAIFVTAPPLIHFLLQGGILLAFIVGCFFGRAYLRSQGRKTTILTMIIALVGLYLLSQVALLTAAYLFGVTSGIPFF